MRKGNKVKDPSTGEIGTVTGFKWDFNKNQAEYAIIKKPDGSTIYQEVGKLVILTFLEWVYEKLQYWWRNRKSPDTSK